MLLVGRVRRKESQADVPMSVEPGMELDLITQEILEATGEDNLNPHPLLS